MKAERPKRPKGANRSQARSPEQYLRMAELRRVKAAAKKAKKVPRTSLLRAGCAVWAW
jgi:hypothetical protein